MTNSGWCRWRVGKPLIHADGGPARTRACGQGSNDDAFRVDKDIRYSYSFLPISCSRQYSADDETSPTAPGIRRERAPCYGMHQGIPIPRPQCHNAMINKRNGGRGTAKVTRQNMSSPERDNRGPNQRYIGAARGNEVPQPSSLHAGIGISRSFP